MEDTGKNKNIADSTTTQEKTTQSAESSLKIGQQFAQFADGLSPKTARGMDSENKKAVEIARTEGIGGMMNHMVTKGDGTRRTYSEMRADFG